jgi:C1A family cysteine protease
MPKNIAPTERVLNCVPSRDREKDWTFAHAVDSGVLTATAAIPPSKDLRQAWWKIGDQGQTGSCVGWASTDSVLRWHFVQAKLITQAQPLAVRYIWMASKETDEYTSYPTTFIDSDGTSLKAALDIARKFGVVLDSLLPFASSKLYIGEVKTFYAVAAQRKIASYFNLGTNLDNWRTWLATKGPILTRLSVDATWDQAANTGGKLDNYQPDTARGGHAVSLVGYTADNRFIVRNSWGTAWGDAGFAYASLGYAQAAFTESYGVAL